MPRGYQGLAHPVMQMGHLVTRDDVRVAQQDLRPEVIRPVRSPLP
jgi:hypothetical protein